jgi:hypothetical protein
LSLAHARSAIHAFYGAKIEATRRSLPGREIAAAIRAIRDERRAAMRALAARKQAVFLGLRERRRIERFGERMAQQLARAPPAPPS